MVKKQWKGLLLLLAMAVLGGTTTLSAQEAPSPKGHWDGAIEIPDDPLGINVDLMEASGEWTGDISIPLQQAENLPLGGIRVTGVQVAFRTEGIPGGPTFAGTLSEDGQSISGSVLLGGQSFPFSLTRK